MNGVIRPVAGMLRCVCDVVEQALGWIGVVALFLTMGMLAWQIFARYVLKAPLQWSEEVALVGFAWVSMIGMVIAYRRGTHARMTSLLEFFPLGFQQAADRVIAFAIGGLGVLITVSGWHYAAETRDAVSAAVGFSMTWLYSAAPVVGALIVLFSVELVICGPRGIK